MSPSRIASHSRALQVLREGGIVCVPTESTYGLAVDSENARALQALAELKGRQAHMPFALIAGDIVQAQRHTGPWPDCALRLANEFWPGPLTMILPPQSECSPFLLGPSGGVGVRVSSLQSVGLLAAELGRPITATSANPSGQPAATRVAEAREYFADGVDYYLDGGRCAGLASTLVDFDSQGQPIELRSGPISLPQVGHSI